MQILNFCKFAIFGMFCTGCASTGMVVHTDSSGGRTQIIHPTTVLAKQKKVYQETEIANSIRIKTWVEEQDSDNLGITATNWWGIGNIARIFYNFKNTETIQNATTERANISAETTRILDANKTKLGLAEIQAVNPQ